MRYHSYKNEENIETGRSAYVVIFEKYLIESKCFHIGSYCVKPAVIRTVGGVCHSRLPSFTNVEVPLGVSYLLNNQEHAMRSRRR